MQLASNSPNVSKIFESFETADCEKVEDESLDLAYVEPIKISNETFQFFENSNKNDESEERACGNDESEDMFQKYGAKNKSDAEVVKFMAQVFIKILLLNSVKPCHINLNKTKLLVFGINFNVKLE